MFLAIVVMMMFFKRWLFTRKKVVPVAINSPVPSGDGRFCSLCNANFVGERSYRRILDPCDHAKCEACFIKQIEGCRLCKQKDLLKSSDLHNFEGNTDKGSNILKREKSLRLKEKEANQPGNSSSNCNRNLRVLRKSHSDSLEDPLVANTTEEIVTSSISSPPLDDDSRSSSEIFKPELEIEEDPFFRDNLLETDFAHNSNNVSSVIDDGVLPSTSGSTNWEGRSSPRKWRTLQLVSSGQENSGTISKTPSPSTIKVEIVTSTSEPGPSKRVTETRIAVKRRVAYAEPVTQSNEHLSTDCEDYPPETKKTKKRSRLLIPDYITVTNYEGIEGDERKYQCNLCLKKFKTKAHIKYHRFCQEGERPFKCGECGQGFIAKSHYQYHLRFHSGERPYKCKICHRAFITRGKLNRHKKCHTGEKPFECETCGKGFANRQGLNCHNLIHTGDKPFPCNICGKRFTGATNLKKHTLTHTGEKSFTCEICGKSFALKWTLNNHERIHSDERPFACLQCPKAFVSRRQLRRHYFTHSGEKPYRCSFCLFSFPTKDLFAKHIIRHTRPVEVSPLSNEDPNQFLEMAPQEQRIDQGDDQKHQNSPKIKLNGIANPKFKRPIKSELLPAAKIQDTVNPKNVKLQKMIERKFKELHRRLQQQKLSKPNSSK